jgi:transposase
MTEHDVLVGFRLRLFTLADELGNVSAACRAMGVHRSTYYRLKRKVDRWGLEALNVRERRRPRMPNEIGPHLEQRIVAFALAHPGLGPRRISAELARDKWGGIRISEHGVWRVLRRLGLNTRSKRLALVARHRDPYERRPPLPQPERHIEASEPGAEGTARLLLRRPPLGHQGHRLAVHRDRRRLRLRLGRAQDLRTQPPRPPHPRAAPPRRPRAQGGRLEAEPGRHRQRLPVPRQALPRRRRGARRPPALHQGRPPQLQRLRRAPATDHPRGMLAARLRPLARPQDDRPPTRPR